MTTFTAPPDRTGLVLNFGDILNVESGGTATGTTINERGTENVLSGGRAADTMINPGMADGLLKLRVRGQPW
jgi:autotransporter passenger strand-loop-strand repeat protein